VCLSVSVAGGRPRGGGGPRPPGGPAQDSIQVTASLNTRSTAQDAITLENVLTVFDGTLERFGHICIFDTNNPNLLDQFDEAFTRRFDRKLVWKQLTRDNAKQFVEKVYDLGKLPSQFNGSEWVVPFKHKRTISKLGEALEQIDFLVTRALFAHPPPRALTPTAAISALGPGSASVSSTPTARAATGSSTAASDEVKDGAELMCAKYCELWPELFEKLNVVLTKLKKLKSVGSPGTLTEV
jgi:hypothetical protein